MNNPERKRAWRKARAAVRAYSKDPTDSNAVSVEVAWREIRRMDGVSFWREWHTARLTSSKAGLGGSQTTANRY